ncbi:MAG: MBL fold metallo-hydrolase [Methanobacteriaceae archaeon]
MEIKILYDNNSRKNYKNGWGFSCLINADENRILFDTGWNGSILLYNMEVAGINLDEIDKIVLSHQHWDHIGGINHLLENLRPNIYIGQTFSPNLKSELLKYSNLIEVSTPRKISENIFTTGELGEKIREQSLIIKTDAGLVIVTGCAHPGLENIIKISESFGEIYAVMGGFHNFEDLNVLKNIPLIVPCHCTSKKEDIKRFYPQSTIECKAGDLIKF